MNDIIEFKYVEEGIQSNLPDTAGAPYDRKARMYEKLVGSKLYNRIIWGTSPDDYSAFAKMALAESEGRVLDIGCGGLVQTAGLYAKANCECFLLDNSIEMLRIAKQRLIDLCRKLPDHIQLFQADAFDLPFEDDHFDAVFSFGMIHLFEDKAGFIREALRVLKPGHRFYFTSLTSDRPLSRRYMNLLRRSNEFGEPLTSKQTHRLFDDTDTRIESYQKGSMVFIRGIKN